LFLFLFGQAGFVIGYPKLKVFNLKSGKHSIEQGCGGVLETNNFLSRWWI